MTKDSHQIVKTERAVFYSQTLSETLPHILTETKYTTRTFLSTGEKL